MIENLYYIMNSNEPTSNHRHLNAPDLQLKLPITSTDEVWVPVVV